MRKVYGAALATCLLVSPLALSGCDEFNAITAAGGLGNITVPSNVSQGASDLGVLVKGIKSVFTLVDYTPSAKMTAALNQLQADAAAIGQATTNDTAAPLVQQFETALNALVAAEAKDPNLPALAQTALSAASAALPVIEALIPLPASVHAKATAPVRFAAAMPFTSPQQAFNWLAQQAK